MHMIDSAFPPSYPKGGSYADLLFWHLFVWGTRPGGSTTERGEPWTEAKFRKEAFEGNISANSEQKSYNSWLGEGKRYSPGIGSALNIARVLFDGEPQFRVWIEDLEEARKRSKGNGNNVRTITLKAALFELGHAAPTTHSIPRPTPHFMGRDEDVAELASLLVAPTNPTAVLVQGGPGMGKTELTKAIAHHVDVVTRFAERRWLVPLATAPSGDAMEKAIVRALGYDSNQPLQEVLNSLQGKQTLLVLDNLETPWERPSERQATEQVLANLGMTPGVTLVASFRGFDFVGGPRWKDQRVEALPSSAATELFAAIGGEWVRNDADLSNFITGLGGVPLAIRLVALRAHGRRSLAPLWREWLKIGVDFAKHDAFDQGALTSLPHSIELSLQSIRMSAPAHRLFRLLGCLPDGLADDDRPAVMGEPAFDATESLLRVGLAIERAERIDLLPPIRDHALRHHPPISDDTSALTQHFAELVRKLAPEIGKNTKAAPRLEREFRNIESILKIALREGRHIELLDVVRKLQLVTVARGIHSTIFIELADSCDHRHKSHVQFRAYCLYLVGEAALYREEFATAEASFEGALPLFREVGDPKGEAACLYEFGNLSLTREDFESARNYYSQATTIYKDMKNLFGEVNCVSRIGEVAFLANDYDEAVIIFNEGLLLAREAGNVQVESNCIRYLGEIAFTRREYDEARTSYEESLRLYRLTGSIIGEATCIQGLGDIALACAKPEAARLAYEEARELFTSVGLSTSVARCIEGLGDVALVTSGADSAKVLYDEALPAYRHAGDVKSERRCVEKLSGLGTVP